MSQAILAEEDRLFRDTVRSWIDAEISKDWCRALEREEDAFPHDFWDKLCAFGAHGIDIPEEYGGQGGSIVTHCPGTGAHRRGPRHSDPWRHGLLRRDGYAALLARRQALAHRADQQRDGEEYDRRGPRPAAVFLNWEASMGRSVIENL